MDKVQAGNMHKLRSRPRETIGKMLAVLCISSYRYKIYPPWGYGLSKICNISFQVLIEGVWGNNRVSGFVAIDDVTLFSGDCDGKLLFLVSINTHKSFL